MSTQHNPHEFNPNLFEALFGIGSLEPENYSVPTSHLPQVQTADAEAEAETREAEFLGDVEAVQAGLTTSTAWDTFVASATANDVSIAFYTPLVPRGFVEGVARATGISEELIWAAGTCNRYSARTGGTLWQAWQQIKAEYPDLHRVLCARVGMRSPAPLD